MTFLVRLKSSTEDRRLLIKLLSSEETMKYTTEDSHLYFNFQVSIIENSDTTSIYKELMRQKKSFNPTNLA